MTALRQSAIMELEKIPEDKLSFVIQIMQGVNGLYNNSNKERKEAFARLEQLRKKGTVTDYDAELASYREDKYGKTLKEYSDLYGYKPQYLDTAFSGGKGSIQEKINEVITAINARCCRYDE